MYFFNRLDFNNFQLYICRSVEGNLSNIKVKKKIFVLQKYFFKKNVYLYWKKMFKKMFKTWGYAVWLKTNINFEDDINSKKQFYNMV